MNSRTLLSPGYSVGELLIMGFNGKSLSAETISTLQNEGVSQFILFGPNYESKDQLIALTDELQSYANKSIAPFLISADQEGGRVQRFRKEFTLLPTAKKVGDTDSPKLAYELARIQAQELYAAGIQLNFAPDCDINTNPANPVIGDRAYGDEEKKVSRMVEASVRGHREFHVEPCIKHFPGHGDTHLDSHFALPTVHTELETLRTREFIPFQRAIQSGCRFVMSAHLMLPHIDAELPGTFSKTFLQKYLREELGFPGIVVSDDMEMHAVAKNWKSEELPVLALLAGCDLLCYKSEEESLVAIEGIKKGLQDKQLDAARLERSIDRVREVRKNIKLAQTEFTRAERLNLIGNPDHQEFVSKNFA